MTITGLVTALLVGVTVGLLGGLVLPGRREAPIWLTVAVGVVAALAGTVVAHLAGVDTRALNPLAVFIEVGLAGAGVVLVVATARSERSDSA
ncbi:MULTISPECIES: GlsB/YeaQ/YmgE family stress response membrane protein [unclassified Micromonospora]|uniref:GlsB/YeaQ/YmgE family stress response membrane protein n=1 Tax=unclassified Micromonospora TaxID=2617518 RepID=UPI000EF51F69|nr:MULTISPECIES: GlsB/YeaQ/YmgE family stress response membrane protein [unclassified Micromonospora]RLP93276.1 GlsB/YeaQ/YmgE family stress response membrane protein [Micromonospora sp. BL4]RLP98172.1 GlsB/YeaQ/YmgE family stress response membrane protein [Micromonospora sp. CV4]